ncbi:Mediator complex, subunit Med4 family-containing protein [Strongyloides ratti]|uniref:Mediator of RNA polymerase II transcription subunit 4 n=1 Tax=Strongyloides ratti TaxID=34506 RepID=A0A090L780_STRRB|nr:Mediator complex, subunit Med4 family-containing protein [Strongyloides ratti]CEF63359.1 Mediator complex, subunit Med4 family-containing protein [Strongyloides ratti]
MNIEQTLKKDLVKDILELDKKMSSLFENVFKKKDEVEENNKEDFKCLVNDISRIEIEIIKKLKNAPCIEKTQKKIKKMKAEIFKYDKAILKTEAGLVRIYGSVTNSLNIAQKKLCELKKSQQQHNTKSDILEMSKNLTKSYTISAPSFYKTGDYVKPFPTGVQFVRGCLKHSIPIKDISKKSGIKNPTINMFHNVKSIQQHDRSILSSSNQQRQMAFLQQANHNYPNSNLKHINRINQFAPNQRHYNIQQQNSYKNLLQRSLIPQHHHSQIPNRVSKLNFQYDQNRFPNDSHLGTKRFFTKPGQSDVQQTNLMRRTQSATNLQMKPQRLPQYSSYLQRIEDGTTFKKAKKLRVGKNMRILPWSSFIDPYYKGYETSASDDSDELSSEEEREITNKYYTRKAGPSVELPVERTDSPETSRHMNYL